MIKQVNLYDIDNVDMYCAEGQARDFNKYKSLKTIETPDVQPSLKKVQSHESKMSDKMHQFVEIFKDANEKSDG